MRFGRQTNQDQSAYTAMLARNRRQNDLEDKIKHLTEDIREHRKDMESAMADYRKAQRKLLSDINDLQNAENALLRLDPDFISFEKCAEELAAEVKA